MENSAVETNRTSLSPTNITDVDKDSLVHCARNLSMEDITNVAISCKFLKTVAYSDPIWLHFSRDRWPEEVISRFPRSSSVRDAYLARHTAVQQLNFVDPQSATFYTEAQPLNSLFLGKNDITFSQGSDIQIIKIDKLFNGAQFPTILGEHRATITSMRQFPVAGTYLFTSESQRKENVLVTSSRDHSIRLWWKGSCHRCFKGHSGPVTTVSDKLLDEGSGKIFASGSEDGTICLWSLSSSRKPSSKATLFGHDNPISFLSVAGHITTLLVSLSNNSKVRVWDTTVSSAVRSPCCVGITAVAGAPVGIKCYESLVYVGSGSSVTAIDLRTMERIYTVADHRSTLQSFEIMPSKSLICTGGINRAILWDIRRNTPNAGVLAKLDGHTGAVKSLHMDSYKIVTASPDDTYINVWDPNTGDPINTLTCTLPGCSAFAVSGSRIVTWNDIDGHICYRDFGNAMSPVSSHRDEVFFSDSDEYDS